MPVRDSGPWPRHQYRLVVLAWVKRRRRRSRSIESYSQIESDLFSVLLYKAA